MYMFFCVGGPLVTMLLGGLRVKAMFFMAYRHARGAFVAPKSSNTFTDSFV